MAPRKMADVRAKDAPNTSGGLVVWLTGLPGSGKSAIANGFRDALAEHGFAACVIDGDALRKGLCTDLGFSEKDRQENVRRAGEIAKLMAEQGQVVAVALVSPYARDRQAVRARMQPGMFMEVFVDCPVAECRRRDPKGMYARADRGEIPQFTGVSDPYEPPTAPDLRLRTDKESLEMSVHRLMEVVCAPPMP